jgi:hypothetical protein
MALLASLVDRGRRRFAVTVVVAGLLAAVVPTTAGALSPNYGQDQPGSDWTERSFADVPRGGELERSVRWLAATGITTGVGGDPGRFAPHGDVTRGQMAAFLWRMMDKAGAPARCGFTDVSPTAFYAPAVCWLRAEGITTGTGDGTTFSPDDRVTRAQMARFLWRLAGRPEAPAPANFDDVDRSAGFAAAVDWLRAHGITQGLTGTNSFAPLGVVNRSQMAQFLRRLASTAGAWANDATLPRTVAGEYRCLAIGHCPEVPPCPWDHDRDTVPADAAYPARCAMPWPTPCYRPDGTQGDPTREACTGGPMIPGDPGSFDPGKPGVDDPSWPGDPDSPDPTEPPIATHDVIGLPELRAIETLQGLGYTVRVVERDGQLFPGTTDYRLDRVNLVIGLGVVVNAFLG